MDQLALLNENEYKYEIRIALWAAILYQFDIMFVVIQLTKFQVVPKQEHLKEAYRVWGILKELPALWYSY